ncbi:hypothetical protein I4U23_024302 [Adineta vaga]|nr:hypothetical protein I4U23_024302 [Adineta vaga]
MLSSLKKWVQDVTVDLAPPPPPPSSHPPRPSPSTTSFISSSSIPEATHHYFYSTSPFNEQHASRYSTSSVVYISKPVSLDSMQSARNSALFIPPPLVSPADIDLSHLNREEQEHIANVLRRARAVEEQQSPLLPVMTIPSAMSPAASVSPSLSSSSTSTNSFIPDNLERYDNEMKSDAENSLILTTYPQCQICGKIHQETSPICSQCQENELIDSKEKNHTRFIDEQSTLREKSLSPITILNEPYENDIIRIDEEIENANIDEEKQSIKLESSAKYSLTEIDENEFFYEEPSPYVSVIVSNKSEEQSIIQSYQIDECIDEDDHEDEFDHVKELEKTIENLSRHLPKPIDRSSSTSPINKIDKNSILEMEIESPIDEEEDDDDDGNSSRLMTHPLSLSISGPIPITNRRGSLSRSSGIRQNLTDLLIPVIPELHQTRENLPLIYRKRMLSTNRHKRNLPLPPDFIPRTQLQLRRANSESRFTLPAVPPQSTIISPQNLDDECDLLEIDLSNPIGSLDRTIPSKLENDFKITTTSNDNFISKGKQLRDQTTNTPPMKTINSSIKTKKKLKKKESTLSNHVNESVPTPTILPTKKLQKSTSTEITYPFSTTKLILNPSRHGINTDLGFRIAGGQSIPHCMEVTACIENIDIHHRNYQILKNIVQEGDEVLELGGVSLRGKSALFVENLMNTIQNEFEIIVRSQSTHVNSYSSQTTDMNIQRRHSMEVLKLASTNHSVTKSKSTSIYSLQKKAATATIPENSEEESKPSPTKMLLPSEDSTHVFSHRPRSSLLPNDPGLNGAGSHPSIERQNSNESDESDSLSQYFDTSQSRTSSLNTTSISHGRSQSVIPLASGTMSTSRNLHNLFKSDNKRISRGSTSMDRKSSLALGSLNFLKKKTKSVDFSNQRNTIINQLRENDYVGDIEIQIGHDNEREQLVVRIIQAKNLIPKDTNGFSDPFVKIYLLPGRDQENKRRIKHVSKTLNPIWNHTVIYGHIHREEIQYKKLEFTVWDYDRFKANDFIGQVTIDLKNPNVIDDKPHWYRLQALRSREETTNRGSSPRLFKMVSIDSSASSLSAGNKNSVHIQPPRFNQTQK